MQQKQGHGVDGRFTDIGGGGCAVRAVGLEIPEYRWVGKQDLMERLVRSSPPQLRKGPLMVDKNNVVVVTFLVEQPPVD